MAVRDGVGIRKGDRVFILQPFAGWIKVTKWAGGFDFPILIDVMRKPRNASNAVPNQPR